MSWRTSLVSLASVGSSAIHSAAPLTLYQYAICPWCQKVRAALDYYNVDYKKVEVNPWSKKEIKWSKEYRKVPILRLGPSGGLPLETIVESDTIMRRIRAMKTVQVKPSHQEDAALDWANKKFIPALTVNLYRSWREAAQTFQYLSNRKLSFGPFDRTMAQLSGTFIMKMISPRLKKKYNVKGDERQHLYTLTDQWLQSIDYHYSGGLSPNLGDLAVYGALRAVESHPVYSDLVDNTRIGEWRATKLEGLRYDNGKYS